MQPFLGGEIQVAEPPEELVATAWQIAARFGWARTYDAEYIALARLLASEA